MSTDEKSRAEAVGANFDREMFLHVRERTRKAINDIAAGIRPGMPEEEAVTMAKQRLRAAEMLRGWQGLHVPFGPNTLKNFGQPSEPGVVLRDNDIFFIDIGPVWQKWEGDGGDTFVVGNDPEMLKAQRDVRELFRRVRAVWLAEGLSGTALYDFAAAEARVMGWELNLDMSGHRLADFPHAVLHKGALAQAAFTPSPGLWVLEIQIRHPDRPFSAFYEDLLLADDAA